MLRFGRKSLTMKFWHEVESLKDEWKRFCRKPGRFTLEQEEAVIKCLEKLREAQDAIATDIYDEEAR